MKNELTGTITHEDLLYDQKALEHSVASFSYSRITSWYQCSLMWAISYILKVKTSSSSAAVVRGEQLHEYYEVLSKTDPDTDEFKTVMREFRKKYPIESLKFTKTWLPHRDKLPKGPNEFFEYKLDMPFVLSDPHKKIKLIGYADYLNMNDVNNTIIIDFKSGKTKSAAYSDQAALYSYFIFMLFPKVQRISTYLYDISDNLERSVVTENSFEFTRIRDLDNLRNSLDKMISDIIKNVNRREFIATPCMNCAYCPLVSCVHNRFKAANKRPEKKLDDIKIPINTNNTSIIEPLIVPESESSHAINIEPGDIGLKEFFGFTTVGDKEKALLLELKQSLDRVKSNNEVSVVSEKSDRKGIYD
jgi:hypothetical protein